MRNLILVLGAIALVGIGVACSGGGGTKTATPEGGDFTASPQLTNTLVASGTASALQTLQSEVTVLPDGTVVNRSGDVVPPDIATQAAAAPTAPADGGGPGTAPTPGVPATPAPLCVFQPTTPNCATTPPEPTAIAPGAQGIAIDSNVATPNVDGGPVTAGAGQNFTVGINIASVPQPYQAYDWTLVIDGPIDFVSSVPDKPAGLTVCGEATQVGPEPGREFYSGCLSTTNKDLTFVGRVDTVTLQCSGAGSGQLHLRKPGEVGATPGFATELVNSSAQPITGDVGPAVQVTCT